MKGKRNRINKEIFSKSIRLVGDNVTNGVVSLSEAMRLADDLGLDLVEMAYNDTASICRVMDYEKFLYEKKKADKANKPKKTVIKELRFTPNTDDHDFDFKVKHAEEFLRKGNIVKSYVQFKGGRELAFKERGELVLLRLADKLADFAVVDNMPKLEGKKMFMTLRPK